MPRSNEKDGANAGKQPPRLNRFLSRISDRSAQQLNAKELRTARRIAQKRGVQSENDDETLRLLKALVEEGREKRSQPKGKAPVPRAKTPQSPLPPPDSDITALKEIESGLAHKRHRRLRAMLLRLAVFVILPASILSGYFAFWATPHFATYTELVIQRDNSGSSNEIGLLSAFQTPMTTEAAAVQGFLTSREAMARLIDQDAYRIAVSSPDIDWLQRLDTAASNEDIFEKYQDQVRIGFDPTDNVIKMEVIAATPEHSLRFAQTLIAMAEAKVDQMSQRLRSDRLRGARDSYDLAEARLAEAQDRFLTLQHKRGVLSTELEASTQMSQIGSLQTALYQRQLELAELRDNLRPNPTREAVLVKSIDRHRAMIAELRGSLTSEDAGSASLARIDAELKAAQSELDLRQAMLSQTLGLMETARVEANRQTIYLATSVAPVLPDKAAYPKILTNILLSFLGFAGLYLMVSLTGAILRDQVR